MVIRAMRRIADSGRVRNILAGFCAHQMIPYG